MPGYKEKGRWVTLTRGFINTDHSRCVTHSDPEEKGATSFVWRAHRDETPSFSGKELHLRKKTFVTDCIFDEGFLVHNYRSYSVLEADPTNYLDFTQARNDTLKGKLLLCFAAVKYAF